MTCTKYALPNGTVIVLDDRPYVEDFAFGLAFTVGPRDERPEEHGLAHCVEHMVSRGSPRFPTAMALIRPLENFGAVANAFTEYEFTAYHARTPAEGWRTAVDLTTDMVFNPIFDPKHLRQEKGAIEEERVGYEDDPRDKAYYTVKAMLHEKSTLGHEIVGSKRAIRRITPEGLRNFQWRGYVPRNTVAIAVGQLDSQLLPFLTDVLGSRPDRPFERPLDDPGRLSAARARAIERKELEQVQLGLGFRLPFGHGHPLMPAAKILAAMIGNLYSSLLYEEMRNKRGQVYMVDSKVDAFRGVSDLSITAGLQPNKMTRALETIVRELRKIKRRGLTDEDLNTGRLNRVHNLTLVNASLATAVEHHAYQFANGDDRDIEHQRQAYRDVTNDHIIMVARQILRADQATLVTVGPVADLAPYLPILDRLDD